MGCLLTCGVLLLGRLEILCLPHRNTTHCTGTRKCWILRCMRSLRSYPVGASKLHCTTNPDLAWAQGSDILERRLNSLAEMQRYADMPTISGPHPGERGSCPDDETKNSPPASMPSPRLTHRRLAGTSASDFTMLYMQALGLWLRGCWGI